MEQAPLDPSVAYCVKAAPRARDADSAEAAAEAAITAAAAVDAAATRRAANGKSTAVKRPRQTAESTSIVVPDLVAILAQMGEMGQGLVLDVLAGAATRAFEPSLP